jgi:HTH-type transcriptional regulator/antitoxin HigA
MDIRPIRSDDDHRAALQEIERLWEFPDNSPENDKLDVLATLVEVYEATRWPIGSISPRDILEYAISDMGRSQKELAALLGSRSQASDLLSGRRKVSLEMAQKISAAWQIPIQLLVAPYDVSSAA